MQLRRSSCIRMTAAAGSEREELGRCVAGLTLESHHRAVVPGPHGDWLYTFTRSALPPTVTAKVQTWRKYFLT